MDIAISTPSLHLYSSPLSFNSRTAISLQAPRGWNAHSTGLLFGSHRVGRRIITVKADQSSSGATDDGFIIEDVPHLTDFLPDLPVILISQTLITKFGATFVRFYVVHNDLDDFNYRVIMLLYALSTRVILLAICCLWLLCGLDSQFQLEQGPFSCYAPI